MKIFVKSLCTILVLILAGCSTSEPERDEIKYNPIVSDTTFQKSFENRKIIVLAPGSSPPLEKIQALQELSFLSLEFPEGIFNFDDDTNPYHANSDPNRFHALKQALESKTDNEIIWTIRGGYGSARLIDALKKLPQPKMEKQLVGYSDLTALHLYLSQRWNWKTIHGPMLIELLNPNKDPENFKKLADLLSGNVREIEINQLVPLNEKAKELKSVQGRLTGGNLTIVQTSLGTDWQIQTPGKILFFEDDGEKGYQLDRKLNHLKQAGLFKGVKAIVFGEFSGGDGFVDFALQRFASETDIPIFKTEEFGHGTKNFPLVYNADSTIVPVEAGGYQLKMQVKN